VNMKNYQPTSAPYSADNLGPHDEGLALAIEFGTDVTAETGQAFVTSDAGGAGTPSINARLGMLQFTQDSADPDSMAGTTFLIPPWSTYDESPVLGPDAKVIVVYAHFLCNEMAFGDAEDSHALLVLADEDFVGNVDNEDCTAIAIRGSGEDEGVEADALIQVYGNGAGQQPSDEEEKTRWGTNLYVRLIIVGDTAEEKESEAGLWLSRDGLTWTPAGEFQIQASGSFRRIGIGYVGTNGTCWLDWLRIYNYRLTGAGQEEQIFQPPLPLTGGRRF